MLKRVCIDEKMGVIDSQAVQAKYSRFVLQENDQWVKNRQL